jgi:hypothetical protein
VRLKHRSLVQQRDELREDLPVLLGQQQTQQLQGILDPRMLVVLFRVTYVSNL